MKQVVINRYNGDTEWTNQLIGCDVLIYNKYDPLVPYHIDKGKESLRDFYERLYAIPNYIEMVQPRSTDISNLVPNLGQDAYTFFLHIINHYDNLADMNIFLHDNPIHHCQNLIEQVNDLPEDSDFVDFGQSMLSDEYGGPMDHDLPVGEIYERLFGKKKTEFVFKSGSLFAASRDVLLRYDIDFYRECAEIGETDPRSSWAFERLFRTIFKRGE